MIRAIYNSHECLRNSSVSRRRTSWLIERDNCLVSNRNLTRRRNEMKKQHIAILLGLRVYNTPYLRSSKETTKQTWKQRRRRRRQPGGEHIKYQRTISSELVGKTIENKTIIYIYIYIYVYIDEKSNNFGTMETERWTKNIITTRLLDCWTQR